MKDIGEPSVKSLRITCERALPRRGDPAGNAPYI